MDAPSWGSAMESPGKGRLEAPAKRGTAIMQGAKRKSTHGWMLLLGVGDGYRFLSVMESPRNRRRLILPEAGRLSALLASDVVRFDGLSAHKAVQLVLSPFAGI